MTFCTSCGSEIEEQWIICPNCGASIKKVKEINKPKQEIVTPHQTIIIKQEQAQTQKQKQKGGGRIVGFCICCLVTILVAFMFIFPLFGG